MKVEKFLRLTQHIGLFQKKSKQGQVEDMEFPGVLKKKIVEKIVKV